MEKQGFADLYTPEGESLAGQPWRDHPRPHLQRGEESWVNLNGMWQFACSEQGEPPAGYPEEILVPFPPESLLSGIHRTCPEGHYCFYRKVFSRPAGFETGRVFLRVGAADQVARAELNGEALGEHVGGYAPFSFEITHLLREENELVIRVWDDPRDTTLPYGKQRAKRGGMWYTPISGIWQTVWLERVPEQYIEELEVRTGPDWAEITARGVGEGEVTVHTPEGDLIRPLREGRARVELPHPMLWSPEQPYLYRFTLQAGEDRAESYFALRTLEIRAVEGIPRLCLNGRPYFFHGVLDQGYWSDGLFTPAHPICYEKDILAMKELGFNTLRKHIKVEPEAFYYACDRLGMVVFQDLVNNGDYSFLRDTGLPTLGWKRRKDGNMHRKAQSRACFLEAMEQTVAQLGHHPCICWWTVFNEGWGQFESTQCYRKMKQLDPTRFVAGVSGWFKGGESDVEAEHVYFKPFRPHSSDKPLVLSEFGGYSCTPAGHAFHPGKEYGYRHFDTPEALEQALVELYEGEILPAIPKGLCGSIYTQLSDVEDETNGFLSFDRKVRKVRPEAMKKLTEQM